MSRLHVNGEMDTNVNDLLFRMSEGNPGAIAVLMDGFKKSESIDPDNWAGPLGLVVNLDWLGIYGSRIWILYKDVCGENIARTIAILRSVQMGIISKEDLESAMERKSTLDIPSILEKIKAELPNLQV
jgi:hypothetical protein